MKRIAALFIFLIGITGYTHAQDKHGTLVDWYTIEKAQELNKENPKKILIDVYTDWCKWCKVMDNKTFSHPKIAEYINENYYAVKFDAESKEPVTFRGETYTNNGKNHQLASSLLQGRLAFPSIAYLDENLQLLSPVPGFKKPHQMEPILKFFGEDIYKNQGWKEFEKNFDGEIEAPAGE